MSDPIKKAYIVEWTGPFTDEQLEQIKDKPNSGCLYIVSGLKKYQRKPAKIQYIGITERGAARR